MRREASSRAGGDRYGALISSVRWQRLRRSQLSQHPLCEDCLGRGLYVEAEVVHHVRPVEGGASMRDMAALCFDPANLMSLCTRCHNRIHTEMGSRSRDRQKRRHEAELDDFKRKFL